MIAHHRFRRLVLFRTAPRIQPHSGAVAVVAGATRGAGRGIARALGEAGATVYCTGRSVRANRSPYNRPETVEETAEMISAAGGSAVPLRVDHTVEEEVQALFQGVERERGRLDILVNSIAGEDPLMAQWCSFWKTACAQRVGSQASVSQKSKFRSHKTREHTAFFAGKCLT